MPERQEPISDGTSSDLDVKIRHNPDTGQEEAIRRGDEIGDIPTDKVNKVDPENGQEILVDKNGV